jgi:hypothetical protein
METLCLTPIIVTSVCKVIVFTYSTFTFLCSVKLKMREKTEKCPVSMLAGLSVCPYHFKLHLCKKSNRMYFRTKVTVKLFSLMQTVELLMLKLVPSSARATEIWAANGTDRPMCIYIVMRRVLRITGSSSDDWIDYHFGYKFSLNYN